MTDIPKRANQQIAQRIKARHLMELTAEEVAESRRRTHAKLREFMAARGFVVPDGELELTVWLRDVIGYRPKEQP